MKERVPEGRYTLNLTIDKALGHSDISVTTRYLHLDKNEVAESLKSEGVYSETSAND
ncbi:MULTISPECIES: hypothetical protein [unclassified Bacillus (in: firmicutes)]|uniref:hypothetical protein n=1 Tax=unclassified Bacillus (in: firmicutes) TaxID=185979 RepID=UPI001479AFD1|nr:MULTISPECIES: hypothetical protein [unclassified Bacillus (in: firmicutes)]